MEVSKYEHEYFVQSYYSNLNINWYNPQCIRIMAGDTETHLYYNDELLTEEHAAKLMHDNGQSWCRRNIHVKAWAFMLATDEVFICFQNIEDFLKACALLRVRKVFFYGAKFDFAIFDYYFLTHDWKLSNDIVHEKNTYSKISERSYNSLHGQQGQRYKLTFWESYINKNKDIKVHRTDMYDLFNVLQGGLKANLESWDVTDNEGNPVRKLEMDYVSDKIDDCINYLINDSCGLYYLVKKFSDSFEATTGLSYINGDFMTCGGAAKKCMLQAMYNDDYKSALKKFHKDYYMTKELDELFRENHLYRGGLSFVNPRYIGKEVRNVYKFDENSMYPHKMRTMDLPFGRPRYETDYYESDDIKIFHVKSMYGVLKKNKIGVWQDLTTGDFCDIIHEDKGFFIFEEELEELSNWYDLTVEYDYIYYYERRVNEGLRSFIDKFYKIKSTSRGTVKLSSKIILNSSYGKLAEKCTREVGVYELSEEGYVHYVVKEEKTDTRNILSVVVGAYITALARTDLMKSIRKVCRENVKKNFIYCDTDSMHTFTNYIVTDPKILGMFKDECPRQVPYNRCIYLAPKSYLMLHEDYVKESNNDTLVIHCKGVNVKEVRKLIDGKTFEEMIEVFRPNYPISCLTGINAIGGKALIYKEKYILRDDEYVQDKTFCEGGIFYER